MIAKDPELEMMRDELEDVRREIGAVIAQIDTVRADLNGEDSCGIESMCCCCKRRDLRRLEDRLWLRLHQLQEKENELHRQRTAILSRPLLPGVGVPCPTGTGTSGGDPLSPSPSLLRQQPPPVSPEAPDSPPWRQQQQQQQQQYPLLPDRRRLVSTSTAENHVALPPRGSASEAGAAPTPRMVQASSQRQPVPATRPISLRRRPCRPGSAEDTGSGAE